MANEFKVKNGIIVNGAYSGGTLTADTINSNGIITSGGTDLLDIFTNDYTTGTTIVGNTLYFDRTDSLSAYTADLSSLGGATELNDLTDVTTALPSTPTEADDGKILFYDHDISQWTTDDAVTHGTVVINAKKDSAGTIAKGLPVYLVGFDSDLHTVELANANSGSTMPVIGFASEQLDNSNSKHVTTFGKLTGIDTSSTVSTLNPNGETWAVNDALYISTTTGGLTKVRPTGGSSLIQRIAKVLKVSATGGQIFVFNTARTSGLPNLTTDNVWVGDVNGIPQEVNKSTLGGNTLYSADDSLTGNRLFNLDSKSLTITGGTTNNATPINFEFGGFWQGYTRWGDEGDLQIKSNNNKHPLKVFKKTDTTNPTLQVNSSGGGLLTELWSYQDIGGSTTKIDINNTSIRHYFGGGEYHRIQLGGAGSGVYYWQSGFGSLGGFVVGGNSVIGTENISLQGSTLVSDKFEIQTTTDGFLMPRLTTAQMNAISSPDTHLVIFNTDLNALYRYNGSAWVAMAAGYGLVGVVRDSDNGNPTFYSDLQSALDTCKASGSYNTVTLYGNHTTTTGIVIDNTFDYKYLTINFNGFKLENTQSDATHTLEVKNLVLGATTVLLNGSLIRENGTTGKCLNHSSTTRHVQMSKMYLYNENYLTLNFGSSVDTAFDFGGSIFESGPSATIEPLRLSYSNFRNFTVISNSSQSALFMTNSANVTDFTAINTSTGGGVVTQTSCVASNFYVETVSGNAVGGGIFSNFVAKSVSGIAVNSPTEAHDFVATTGDNRAVNISAGENFSNFRAENNSSTNACVYLTNTNECVQAYAKNKGSGVAFQVFRNQANRAFSYNKITAISEGGIGASVSSNPGFKILFSDCEFVSKWDNVGGHSVQIGGNDTVLTNCSLRVRNAGANNITASSSISAKVVNSTFDGATTPINSNVTLSNTFTSDPYGNITI